MIKPDISRIANKNFFIGFWLYIIFQLILTPPLALVGVLIVSTAKEAFGMEPSMWEDFLVMIIPGIVMFSLF